MDKAEAIKNARNEYLREWRKRNPDKIREINERYWLRRLGKIPITQPRKEEHTNVTTHDYDNS